MTTDNHHDLLLNRGRDIDAAWFDELRLGGNIYHHARLLEPSEAERLEQSGYGSKIVAAPTSVPKHLRNHYVCELNATGWETCQRINGSDEPTHVPMSITPGAPPGSASYRQTPAEQVDPVTIATALGAGSSLLNELGAIRELVATCVAELIAVRCSMMVAARLSGQGEAFADALDELMGLTSEESAKKSAPQKGRRP